MKGLKMADEKSLLAPAIACSGLTATVAWLAEHILSENMTGTAGACNFVAMLSGYLKGCGQQELSDKVYSILRTTPENADVCTPTVITPLQESTRQHSTIIIYGEPGCGKTRNAAALAKHFRKKYIVDNWSAGMQIRPDAVLLTNMGKTAVFGTIMRGNNCAAVDFYDAMIEITASPINPAVVK
jgi:hypothetical protein